MKKLPYYDRYVFQGSLCTLCDQPVPEDDYCVINTPEGIEVIHYQCLKKLRISGCRSQIEVLHKPNKV